MVEAEPYIHKTEHEIINKLKKMSIPAILVINKIDRSNPVKIAETIAAFSAEHDFAAVVPVSALKEKGVRDVLDEASGFLSESPWFSLKT